MSNRSLVASITLAVLCGVLVGLVCGDCGAPDGFWDEYHASAQQQQQQQQPQQKQPQQKHDHHGHGHSHDHHGHGHSHHHQQQHQQQHHQQHGRAEIATEDYDEVIARIEREVHGRDDSSEEPFQLFGENFILYATSGVFGFLVLIPFWMPFILPLFVKKDNAQKPEVNEASGDELKAGIQGGWFLEINKQWPGQAMALKVKKVLLDEQTKFQHLVVFDSESFGRVMVLDGVIQITERDEYAYQEMLTHIPLFAHPNPERVLVLGGGDGGVLREVLKHSCVKSVDMCEIDEGVVNAAKKFFPAQSTGFDDKRTNLIIGDAIKFCEDKGNTSPNSYDVIVLDSSDPEGPANGLFQPAFYSSIHKLLAPGGIMCAQGESLWLNLDLMKFMKDECGKEFSRVDYASIQIPTYPCGQIGAFVVAKAREESGKSKDEEWCGGAKPTRQVPKDMKLRFYTNELHAASFVLPKFVQDKLEAKAAKSKK